MIQAVQTILARHNSMDEQADDRLACSRLIRARQQQELTPAGLELAEECQAWLQQTDPPLDKQGESIQQQVFVPKIVPSPNPRTTRT